MRFTNRYSNGKSFIMNCTLQSTNGIEDAIEKLAQYEDLEEQGKLMILSHKIGDAVCGKNSNWSGTVEEISINRDGIFLYINSGYNFYVCPDDIK